MGNRNGKNTQPEIIISSYDQEFWGEATLIQATGIGAGKKM